MSPNLVLYALNSANKDIPKEAQFEKEFFEYEDIDEEVVPNWQEVKSNNY